MVHEELTIRGISAESVPDIWYDVLPLLRPCIHEIEMDEWDLFEELWNSTMQLWIGERNGEIICAMTTRIDVYSQGKIASILHVGGEFDEAFKNYLPRLKEWAVSKGAGCLRMVGRVGWNRWLKEHFDKTYYVMEAELWVA
jgi:hypothetical protein